MTGRRGGGRRVGDRRPRGGVARTGPDKVQAARPRVTPPRRGPVELRVLGCLIEKQRTTPEQYPLSLNALRLAEGVPTSIFAERTGFPLSIVARQIDLATRKGLLEPDPLVLKPTQLGRRFPNDLQQRFLPGTNPGPKPGLPPPARVRGATAIPLHCRPELPPAASPQAQPPASSPPPPGQTQSSATPARPSRTRPTRGPLGSDRGRPGLPSTHVPVAFPHP